MTTSRHPLHVVHLLEASGGGAMKHLAIIAEGLCRVGVKVDVILSPLRGDPDFDLICRQLQDCGCTLTLLPMHRLPGPGDFSVIKKLRQTLRNRQPDILHTHCARAGMLGRLAALKLSELAVVHTPHSFFFEGLPRALQFAGILLERGLGRRTDLLACVSEAEAELAQSVKIQPRNGYCLAPNGIPAEFTASLLPRAAARQQLGVTEPDDPTTLVIGFFARLARKKGHAFLFRVLAELRTEERRRIRLILAGDGPEKDRLQQLAQKMNLLDCVSFCGFIPRAETCLNAVDLAVLPSSYEGLAYQLLEALAAGVPVIAADVPGNHPHLPDNPIRYAPPNQSAPWVQHLREILQQPDSLDARRKAGPPWIQQNFTAERQIRLLLKAYNALTPRRTKK